MNKELSALPLAWFLAFLMGSAIGEETVKPPRPPGDPRAGEPAVPAKAEKPKPPAEDANATAARIKSGDPKVQEQALADIRAFLLINPGTASRHIRHRFAPTLLSVKRCDAALELTERAILNLAADTEAVSELARFRAQALLGLGKNEEALSAAKGCYNVWSFSRSDKAIAFMVECLKAARPDDPGIVQRFKLDQLAEPADPNASSAVLLSAGPPPGAEKTVLGSIKAETKPWEKALDSCGTDYAGLMAWGNLLLLSDRGPDAKKVFQKAYRIAPQDKLAEASESLARAMRAEDGSIARANAWLLSIRPPKPPNQPEAKNQF